MLEFLVEEGFGGERIDVFLVEKLEGKTRSAIQKMLVDGAVKLNGSTASKNAKLKSGDRVEIALPEPKELDVIPQNIPLDIVYEDSNILLADKRPGLIVHSDSKEDTNTLINHIKAYLYATVFRVWRKLWLKLWYRASANSCETRAKFLLHFFRGMLRRVVRISI